MLLMVGSDSNLDLNYIPLKDKWQMLDFICIASSSAKRKGQHYFYERKMRAAVANLLQD